jgi:hypothetical protein
MLDEGVREEGDLRSAIDKKFGDRAVDAVSNGAIKLAERRTKSALTVEQKSAIRDLLYDEMMTECSAIEERLAKRFPAAAATSATAPVAEQATMSAEQAAIESDFGPAPATSKKAAKAEPATAQEKAAVLRQKAVQSAAKKAVSSKSVNLAEFLSDEGGAKSFSEAKFKLAKPKIRKLAEEAGITDTKEISKFYAEVNGLLKEKAKNIPGKKAGKVSKAMDMAEFESQFGSFKEKPTTYKNKNQEFFREMSISNKGGEIGKSSSIDDIVDRVNRAISAEHSAEIEMLDGGDRVVPGMNSSKIKSAKARKEANKVLLVGKIKKQMELLEKHGHKFEVSIVDNNSSEFAEGAGNTNYAKSGAKTTAGMATMSGDNITVYLNKDALGSKSATEVLLHELSHAVTMSAVAISKTLYTRRKNGDLSLTAHENAMADAYADLISIGNAIKASIKGKEANLEKLEPFERKMLDDSDYMNYRTDPDEIITYALTDKTFRNILASIDGLVKTDKTMLDSVWNLIVKFLGLEIDPDSASAMDIRKSLFADVVGATSTLMSEKSAVRSDPKYQFLPDSQKAMADSPFDNIKQSRRNENVTENDTGDGRGRNYGGEATPLAGAPIIEGATGPDKGIVEVAKKYARDSGIAFGRQEVYAEVDEERARRIAKEYDEMEHDPKNERVKEAYANMIGQTVAQYRALEAAGYKFYLFDENSDPYNGNPWNAMRDLRSNKRMGVFATESGFGSGATDIDVNESPMLAETGIMWPHGSLSGSPRRVLANDLFRAVHDAFGHGLEGAGFRAQGEENAWQAHASMFTGSAMGALASETRGQNSWLNYGPYGDANRTASAEETVFADQKTGLMPEWTWTEGKLPSKAIAEPASEPAPRKRKSLSSKNSNAANEMLMGAVLEQDSEMLSRAISAGADVNFSGPDDDGNTQLHIAASFGFTNIVNLLIKAGANVDAINQYGATPLQNSVEFHGRLGGKNIESIKLLIDAGADVNARDINGSSPITWEKIVLTVYLSMSELNYSCIMLRVDPTL